MSASLVGSEMCIRDSTRPMPLSTSGWSESSTVQGSCHNAAEAGRSRRKPVSYTHLTLPTICSV
eukprot:7994101-Alexandrium_andersonii.AAC.1